MSVFSNKKRPSSAASVFFLLVAQPLIGSVAIAQEGEVVHELPTMVVTTTASDREFNRAMASVSIVDGVTLRRRPVNDLFDMVRHELGISHEDLGAGGGRGISIRGMSSEHTLFMVDGQRITGSSSSIAHSNYEQSWIPAEAIERIEVVRGPMSSLYGSEALGGVVNVVTRSATDQWEGSFNQLYRWGDSGLKGDLYKTGFYAGGPIVQDVLGINFWGEFRRRKALLNQHDKRLSALDDQDARSMHVGLTWTPTDNQRIDFGLDVNREDLEGVRLSSGRNAQPYEIDSFIRRHRYSLAYKGDWAWGSLQLRWYQTRLKRDVERSDGRDVSAPNRFVDNVWDARTQFNLGSNHRVTVGTELRRERVEDPNINDQQKDSQNHFAFFLQDEITLGERWEAVLGGRFDKHKRFGWEFSPRGYLLFKATDHLTFRAGVGRGFKAPTMKQLSPSFESRAAMGGRGIVRGNPNLDAETNVSYEIGATYQRDTWSLAATLFQNRVKNLIETQRQPTCYERGRVCLNYENVAKSRFQGLELSGSWDISQQLSIGGNYTYLSARDRLNDKPLDDRSRHRANASITWQPFTELETSLRYEYVGSQFRTIGRERVKLPNYSLVHWDINYEVNKYLSVYGGIENITDKRLANDDFDLYKRADEGRRFYAGFNLRY